MHFPVCLILLTIWGAVGSPGVRTINSESAAVSGTNYNRGARASYLLSNYKLSHHDAIHECRNVFQGRLLTIFTVKQDEDVRRQLLSANMESTVFWTSGRYNETRHIWEWLSSDPALPFGYRNFVTDPTNSSSSECAIVTGALSKYGWYVSRCEHKFKFICQLQ